MQTYDHTVDNSPKGETMFCMNRLRWLIIVLGLLSVMIAFPVLAEPPTQSIAKTKDLLSVSFSHDENLIVTDLTGTPVGEGVHTGELRCKDNSCNKKTQLDLSIINPATGSVTLEYKFDALLAFDPDVRRAVVAGTGTISTNDGQNAKFEFTATFRDNGDGTILVTYAASRPDASFIIPNSPGTIEITNAS